MITSIPVLNSDYRLYVADKITTNALLIIQNAYEGSSYVASLGGDGINAAHVFYQDEAHPRGSNYFGIITRHMIPTVSESAQTFIMDAKPLVDRGITAAICSDGETLIYSAHRHDCATSPIEGDATMIDGGTAYVRCRPDAKLVRIGFLDGKPYVVED